MGNLELFLRSPLEVFGLHLSFSPLQIILRFLLPLLIIFIFYYLILFLAIRVLIRPLKIEERSKNKIVGYTRLLLRIIMLFLLAVLVLSFFETDLRIYLSRIWSILKSPFLTAGSSHISIITLVLAIPVFFLAAWISQAARRFVDNTFLRPLNLEEAKRFTIASLVRYAVMVLAALVGLSLIGINLSSLAVILGVLGIGVGFGLQSIVANLFSGLVIILERPIKEGDRIVVSGLEGDVVQIRLRSTIINTLTNETIVIPNSLLVGNSIHNYSYRDKRIIVVNPVQVSYSDDLEQVREVLLKIARLNPYALQEPRADAKIQAFQDSGILVELWTWIADASQKLAASSWTNMQIWKEFKQAGIVIPFPQVDLHVKDSHPPRS